MRMGADPEANFASAVEHIREAARLGAQIVCLPELFRTQYFCQREDLKLFDLAEPIPGPSTKALRAWRAKLGVAIVASLFERRAPGLYHNTAVTLERRRRRSPASTARCTSRTIRFITRSITSRRAISAFRPWIRAPAAWARWSAGTSGIPRARGSRRCREPRCCSIPRPSAGTRRRRMSLAPRSTTRGRPSSARMPLPTASMWLP